MNDEKAGSLANALFIPGCQGSLTHQEQQLNGLLPETCHDYLEITVGHQTQMTPRKGKVILERNTTM